MTKPVVSGAGVLNEQRLAALHRLGLLDSPTEPAFDRLTRLATRLLHVPVAFISLVDTDRQFFKSSIGLPEPWASLRETPLSHSFCQYVVDTGELLVVADAPNHPLVCTNLGISELNIQAYLGIPLQTSDGMVLGSLCAVHTEPHEWNIEDIEILQDLAATVVTEIELRRDSIARRETESALYESNSRFVGAFQYASIGIALVALDGRWLQVNRAVCELVGYTEQELLATTFQAITHPDDLDADLTQVMQLLHGEITTYQMEKRYIHKNGTILWVVLNVSLVRDINGTAQYFVSQIQDISERRRHEWERQHLIEQLTESVDERDLLLQQSITSLKRTEALYNVAERLNRTQEISAILQAVLESAAKVLPADRIVLITVDLEAKAIIQQLEGGQGAEQATALTFSELQDGLSGVVLRNGRAILSLNGVADQRESLAVQQRRQHDQAGSILVAPIQSQNRILGTLTAINKPDGPDFTASDLDLLVTLANQAAIAIERAALLNDLQHHATIDALTQLLNRRSWFEQSRRISIVAEQTRSPLSVVLLDADHFKEINDTYGHDAGDLVLQMISRILKQTVRRSDIIGRYGGEEFVILFPETDAPIAFQIAERIRNAVASQSTQFEQHQLAITVSLGVATMQGTTLELATLITQADKALYKAKYAGRNCTRLWQ